MAQSAIITVMDKAVRKVSPALLRDFSEVGQLQVSKKGTANFVTNADTRTERMLQEELSHARPKFGFLMEENGEIIGEDPEHRWVIDPIDGTTNFIHALPYFCISIALQKRNAQGAFESIAAMVYDPVHDETFTAEKGMGATLNQMKLRVSARSQDSLISTASPRRWKDNYQQVRAALERVTDAGATIRCTGAAALDMAYVAAGRLDGTWYHQLQPWDMAAGALLVEEAGGKVSSIEGQPLTYERGSVVASNGIIHTELTGLLVPRLASSA